VSEAAIDPASEAARAGAGTLALERPAGDPPTDPPAFVISEEPDWNRVELIRRLGCVLVDGTLLSLIAARPRGAAGHGDEVLSAVLVDRDGEPAALGEVRLTTEYDPEGAPRRIGVELFQADETLPALRGAGTFAEIGIFDFFLESIAGFCRYEIVRPG
jgi:hypothetical protein